jgi:molybdopterin molybdotransferase
MHRDVRMKGFAARADVEEVEAFLRREVHPLEAEPVDLADCAGRVLAERVVSPVDVPAFRRAAMDGYAVRGEETFGASPYDPLQLRLVGEALPGRPWAGVVGRGEAARIMTGAPLPEGADAVLMAEVCEEVAARDAVLVREAVAPQRNVGAVGEDLRAGQVLLEPGRRLRPQDVGCLASIGHGRVSCVRRPRVQLVMTGDELLPPGERPRGAHIVDSNSPMLRALVERDGGVCLPAGILPDRPERIRAALQDAQADVLLVSGGSSVGREDHAPRLVAELGQLDYHGIAMRPSSPAGIGRLSGGSRTRWVFLLPGNPVSCLCAYEFFAGPAIRVLGGRSHRWPHARVRMPLARKISSAVGRVDYVRVAVEGGRVVPLATAGASILSSTVRAAGAVVVARGREGMAEGEEVEVLLYDDALPEEPRP